MITLRYYETNDRELLSFVNEEITAVSLMYGSINYMRILN